MVVVMLVAVAAAAVTTTTWCVHASAGARACGHFLTRIFLRTDRQHSSSFDDVAIRNRDNNTPERTGSPDISGGFLLKQEHEMLEISVRRERAVS